MQNAFHTYGENAFEIQVLELADKALLIETEQYYLDSRKPYFNICEKAGSSLGQKHTTKTRKQISAAMKNNSNAKGKGGRVTTPSDKEKKKISDSLKTINYPILLSPDGKEIKIEPSLSSFCKLNSLHRESLRKVLLKKRNHHKGWKIKC